MPYLITPTLISQFDWMKKSPKEWKEKALMDFTNILNRIYPETVPEYVTLGRVFEKYIERAARTGQSGSDKFNIIRDMFVGAKFQTKTQSNIKVDDVDYLLYGRIDALFPEKILDLKTTRNYKGVQYYMDSFQHKIYCYCQEISSFSYVVVEIVKEKDKNVITNHYVLDYNIDNPFSLKEEISEKIREVVNYIESDPKLDYSYKNIFTKF